MASTTISAADREAAIRRAFWLAWLSVGWMLIEATVAVGAGIASGSVTLTAFGLDSMIELLSSGVVIWRLTVELRQGRHFAEEIERIAGRLAGGLLFVLAAYIIASAAWSLWSQRGETFSGLGLTVALLAMPIMLYLSRQKLAVAEKLGSRTLRADAAESVACGWLSLVVVVGLVADLLLDAWWVDPVASLGVLWFVIREGREAWTGDSCCD